MLPQCSAWAFDGELANSKSICCMAHGPCPLQQKACCGAMQPKERGQRVGTDPGAKMFTTASFIIANSWGKGKRLVPEGH